MVISKLMEVMEEEGLIMDSEYFVLFSLLIM